MFGISFAEFFIIFLLILIVMGPEKIPEAARWAGKGMRELRKASNALRNTLAMEDLDLDAPPKERRLTEERPAKSSAPATAGETENGATSTSTGGDPSPWEGSEPPSGDSEPASLPSSGLDQVDDEAFERMLEERYAARANRVRDVEFSPPRPAPDTFTVSIDEADHDTDETIDIGLPAPIAAEKAS